MWQVILVNNKGFTLIEVIVVIAILTILSAIDIPRIVDYKDIAKKQVCYSNCKTMEKYIAQFIIQ
jgi:prepilin-type N-terminal cleavage/methylation domain-containing protein